MSRNYFLVVFLGAAFFVVFAASLVLTTSVLLLTLLRFPDSFLVVRTFTGDLPLTIRASFSTK